MSGSFRCSASQSVLTSSSGWTYCFFAIAGSLFLPTFAVAIWCLLVGQSVKQSRPRVTVNRRASTASFVMGQYRHHVFVCTSGKTCPLSGSVEIHAILKEAVAAAGLRDTVRVNHSGCMNQCGHGPMVVVYPDDVWYAAVDVAGAQRIVAE